MKALTITQPWASAIVLGLKTIETRSWTTSYRGEIAIHAAKGYPAYAREFAEDELVEGRGLANPPLGAVIAVARLAAVKRAEDLLAEWGTDPRWTLEKMYGHYAPKCYGWVLEDVRPLVEPIACKGALGVWMLPANVASRVRQRIPTVTAEVPA